MGDTTRSPPPPHVGIQLEPCDNCDNGWMFLPSDRCCRMASRRSRNFSDIMDLADGVFGDVSIPSEPAEAEEAIRRLLDVSSGCVCERFGRGTLIPPNPSDAVICLSFNIHRDDSHRSDACSGPMDHVHVLIAQCSFPCRYSCSFYVLFSIDREKPWMTMNHG